MKISSWSLNKDTYLRTERFPTLKIIVISFIY